MRRFLFLTVFLFLAGCAPTVAPTQVPTPTQQRILVTFTPQPTRNLIGIADHSSGPANAYVTIVMYGDFQSPICLQLAQTLAAIQNRHPDDVRLVWRHFPQSKNDKAALAAQAAEAANAQGHFWEMHDQLFVHQAEWSSQTPDQFRASLTSYAKLIGLSDLAAFNTALDQRTYAVLVQTATNEATALGLADAPVLLFNNRPYSGRIDDFTLDGQVRLLLLQKRWYASQPDFTINMAKRYIATLVTEKGDVVIELYPRSAPAAVNSFVFLARVGWYNDITFHLVIPGQYAQTGDPSGTDSGTAGYNIVDEHDNGLLFDREGMVAMAHPDGMINSASSQFFISYGPLPTFNKQYTIFGHVTQGMDVLRKLTPRDPADEIHYPNPPPGDKLITVKIDESN